MNPPSESTHITQRLETGRKCLEELADIASQLENAKEGLVRSSYLGDNLDEVPQPLRKLWESLDKDISALSKNALIEELAKLERLLTVRLSALMPLIDAICTADERGADIKLENARRQLADLSRLASTALAIRLLARRRRYDVPPANLPVNSGALRDRAQRVKAVERKHKLAVLSQIKEMVEATTAMMNMEGIDNDTRKMLKSVLRDLQSNAKHLANGGSISTLPVPIEHVEMQDETTEPELDELTLVSDTNDTAAPFNPATLNQTNTATLPAPPAIASPPTAQSPRRPVSFIATQSIKPSYSPFRFWRQLRTWMQAPIGVTWSQAGAMLRTAELKDSSARRTRVVGK
jgi:hypothetical protein